MANPVSSFTLGDVVAGLEARVDELIAVTLRAQGFDPIGWAEEILFDATEDNPA
jgi:hypothetical protein